AGPLSTDGGAKAIAPAKKPEKKSGTATKPQRPEGDEYGF
ncbi:MAG: hypothetical protein K0S65_4619, partial [Labilithrix sp.]|nr:hypothetical protein [Labilithrix sp.]